MKDKTVFNIYGKLKPVIDSCIEKNTILKICTTETTVKELLTNMLPRFTMDTYFCHNRVIVLDKLRYRIRSKLSYK